jgi:hypothetical protein
MRLQTDLLAPGVTDLVWTTTPESLRLADALAERLRELGYDVVRSQDDAEDGAAGAYQEVGLGGDEGIGLAVLDGGGFVSADAWHDEPQRFWVSMMRLLRTVEEVCGWTTPEAAVVAGYAAEYGVRPDGTVERRAELNERELEDAAIELVRRHVDDPELPGRRLPADAPSVVRIREVAERLAREALPAFVVVLESDAQSVGMAAPGLSRQDHDRLDDELGELMLAAEGLHGEVGDDVSGRLSHFVVHIGAPTAGREGQVPGEVRLEPVFDRLRLDGDRLQLRWSAVVQAMLRRDPRWQPLWLPEMRTLLRRAGMRG